jgi:hypothetical protein
MRCIALLVKRSRSAPTQQENPCLARFGFPTDQPAAQQKLHGASRAVAPTTRYNPTGSASPSSARRPSGRWALRAPPRGRHHARRQQHPRSLGETARIRRGRTLDRWAFRLLSWSSSPLRRLSSGESTAPRFTSPGTFRQQGFSPSRRLAPRLNVRPCFMPVTPMGFRSPGISPHSQVPAASAARLPSRRFSSHPRADHCSDVWRLVPPGLAAHVQTIRRPQGLAPAVNPYRREECCIRDPTADSLLSFAASPGYYPDPMAASRATRSLMRFFASTAHEPTEQARRSAARRRGCAPATSPPGRDPTLASAISPPEVFRPSATLGPSDQTSLSRRASGQLAHDYPGTRHRAPRASSGRSI